MILFYYVLSIILCKYTNSPVVGSSICVLLSLYFSMTLIEAMSAFAGAVCCFQIKDSKHFWRLLCINVLFYGLGIIIIGALVEVKQRETQYRIILTFVLGWGTFVCKWLGYC